MIVFNDEDGVRQAPWTLLKVELHRAGALGGSDPPYMTVCWPNGETVIFGTQVVFTSLRTAIDVLARAALDDGPLSPMDCVALLNEMYLMGLR